jgi:hypothetical protein
VVLHDHLLVLVLLLLLLLHYILVRVHVWPSSHLQRPRSGLGRAAWPHRVVAHRDVSGTH